MRIRTTTGKLQEATENILEANSGKRRYKQRNTKIYTNLSIKLRKKNKKHSGTETNNQERQSLPEEADF